MNSETWGAIMLHKPKDYKMKVSKAKKIRSIYGKKLESWTKSEGGYFFASSKIYLTIGNPTGNGELVNLDTIQANFLNDCQTTPYQDDYLARPIPDVKYPTISLGDNFLSAIERSLKIVDIDCARNYGTVALVTSNGLETKIVATDSFVIYEHTEMTLSDNPFTFCIGVNELKALLCFFGKKDGLLVAQLSDDKTVLIIEQQNHKAFIRLSDVKYPNYKPVMPEWHKGHVSGEWNKKLPKVKGAVSALYDCAMVYYFGKNEIKIGSVAIPTINGDRYGYHFSPTVYNPKYIAFVNDSASSVTWHQHYRDPSIEAITFRTAPAKQCTETVVIVPMTYKADDIARLRA
jgi:hypothetical protein